VLFRALRIPRYLERAAELNRTLLVDPA